MCAIPIAIGIRKVRNVFLLAKSRSRNVFLFHADLKDLSRFKRFKQILKNLLNPLIRGYKLKSAKDVNLCASVTLFL